jgi:predicted metal-dependent phosphotriesterase family hydrolase
VAEGVDYSKCGHCSAHDGQYLDDQVVQAGVVFEVDDVDGLDFSHEHHPLEGIVSQLHKTRSQRVTVSFNVLSTITLHHHWDYLQMVEVVHLTLLLLEVLHELP